MNMNCLFVASLGSGAIHHEGQYDDPCPVTMTSNGAGNEGCSSETSIDIRDLVPDTDYVFTVTALNRNSKLIYDVTNTLCSASLARSAKTGKLPQSKVAI